jgi:hypothetical protein
MADLQLVDLQRLRDEVGVAAKEYAAASPFPHIVIDGVLRPEAFAAAAADFPAVDDEFWKGYLHVNETKYCNVQPETWAPSLHDVARELTSPEFVAYLEELTGIRDLIPDWSMDGGGLHQTLRGGHLNIHSDFTTHHVHETWARRVNILLYLNEEWPDEWGGQLELWDADMAECHDRVTPKGNRMLVFTTSFDSFHGHPDGLTCPPGEARRSMALYYFTEESAPVRRATHYRARPEESAVRRAAIAADRVALDLYDRAKRRLGITDDVAHRMLGVVDRVRRKRH